MSPPSVFHTPLCHAPSPAAPPAGWGLVLVAVCALALAAAPAIAQPGFTTGAAAWLEPGYSGSTLRAIPSVALDGPRFSLIGAGLLAGGRRESPYQGSKLAGGLLLEPTRRTPIELRVTGAHRDGAGVPALWFMRGEARLHFTDGVRGAWMGLASEQTRKVSLDSGDWGPALIGFGAWARKDRMSLVLDLEQRAGLFPAGAPPDTGHRPERGNLDTGGALSDPVLVRTTLTTTRVMLRWESERLELESVAGVTLSLLREPRRWAQARASLRLTPDLALFTTVGSRAPELYLIEPAESPSATLGLSLSGWRSADLARPLVARAPALTWRMRDLGGGDYALSVGAPGARLVEIMGDFTGWQPLRLVRAGRQAWETIVALEPGVHQVNLRVDGGAWMVPPGLPAGADGYGGSAGILVTGS